MHISTLTKSCKEQTLKFLTPAQLSRVAAAPWLLNYAEEAVPGHKRRVNFKVYEFHKPTLVLPLWCSSPIYSFLSNQPTNMENMEKLSIITPSKVRPKTQNLWPS